MKNWGNECKVKLVWQCISDFGVKGIWYYILKYFLTRSLKSTAKRLKLVGDNIPIKVNANFKSSVF